MSIDGLASLRKKLRSLDSIAREGAKKGMSVSLLKMQSEAKKHVPVNDGGLKNSIHVELKDNDKELSGKVYTKNDHAIFVEFGTGPVGKASPKEIPPGVALQYKDKGWLIPVKYFPGYAKYGLTPIVIKGVEFIPTRGQRAQQFMTPASKVGKKSYKKEIAKATQEKLKELKK